MNKVQLDTLRKVEIMLAFLEGTSVQLRRRYSEDDNEWVPAERPQWDFCNWEYRIEGE